MHCLHNGGHYRQGRRKGAVIKDRLQEIDRIRFRIFELKERQTKLETTLKNLLASCDHKHADSSDALDHTGMVWSTCTICGASVL
jgi:hypothetical protein